jgi:type II secretory pathway predicted ATPase ExeA/LysM repeat protein
MYTEFFELIEKPFSLSTSPRFLYLGEKHKEALAILKYGVMERQGFVLLTGEVGTGKTTMVRALLASLDTNVKYVHLANPLLSPREFISYLILSSFENKIHFKTKSEFLIAFEAFLTKVQQRNKHFLLVIDEAHKLSFELLEEIRLLSNLETAEEKLISIFLVGQPELNEKLSEARCRPLLQRISVRYHIPPLSVKETGEYIMTRLKKAGSRRAEEIFPSKAINAIHQYSQGYPRMINVLADNSLLLGYSKGESKISPAMVKSCYQDLRLGGSEEKASGVKKAAGQDTGPKGGGLRPWWKWAVAALLVIGILAFVALKFGNRILAEFVSASVQSTEQKVETVPEEAAAKRNKPENEALAPLPVPAAVPAAAPVAPPAAVSSVPEKQPPVVEEVKAEVKDEKKETPPEPALNRPDPPEVRAGPPETKAEPAGQIIVVERGDTLGRLLSRVYGRSNDRVLDRFQKNNPAISDPDLIRPGQKLFFPPISEPSPPP